MRIRTKHLRTSTRDADHRPARCTICRTRHGLAPCTAHRRPVIRWY